MGQILEWFCCQKKSDLLYLYCKSLKLILLLLSTKTLCVCLKYTRHTEVAPVHICMNGSKADQYGFTMKFYLDA